MNSNNEEMEALAWHYTTGQRFMQILESGILLPATTYVPKTERAAVWFSLEQHWEPTAAKLWVEPDGAVRRLDMSETYLRGGGLIRFGVALETCPHDWRSFRLESGIRAGMARRLEKAGSTQGADAKNWRVSFVPVPRAMWVAVDAWDGHEWQRVYTRGETARAA